MYQALYRKWRPRDFSDVVGQEHITETLRRQVAAGRLSHAYLFVGTRGTGKTTCAKILAKAANCEHPVDGNPCNECPSCRGIDDGSILDVEELDAASNNGVDNIRTIRDEAVFTPAAARYRVYIIDEVHMLSASAFNALLKILEEPPEHIIFILATTEIHKVPATILSRCQRYSFKRITTRDISRRLEYVAEHEGIELTPDASEMLARLADGSMRDALSLLDQCVWDRPVDSARVTDAIGLAGAENTEKLFGMVSSGETGKALELLSALYMDGKDPGSVLEELSDLCRDALISLVAPKNGDGLKSGAFSENAVADAAKTPPETLLYMVKTIQAALLELDRSPDRRITAEMCLMQLADARLGDDISALATRISRLESDAAITAQNGSAAETRTPPQTAKSEDSAKKTASRGEKKTAKADADDLPWDIPDKTGFGTRSGNAERQNNAVLPRPFDGGHGNELEQRAEDASVYSEGAESEPAAVQTPPPAAADMADVWKSILAIVEKQIDIAPFSFLSDRVQAEGEITGGKLVVGAKNPVAKMMIDTVPVKTALKAAAEQVAGSPVAVEVTDYVARPDSAAKKTARLDELRKFGNIEFK